MNEWTCEWFRTQRIVQNSSFSRFITLKRTIHCSNRISQVTPQYISSVFDVSAADKLIGISSLISWIHTCSKGTTLDFYHFIAAWKRLPVFLPPLREKKRLETFRDLVKDTITIKPFGWFWSLYPVKIYCRWGDQMWDCRSQTHADERNSLLDAQMMGFLWVERDEVE